MKKLLFSVLVMLAIGVNNSNSIAQDYTIEGKNIKVNSSRAKRDTLVTDWTLEDSKGVKRVIIFDKNTGHGYTCRIGKNGFYRAQLPKKLWSWEKQKALELGLPYKEHKTQK